MASPNPPPAQWSPAPSTNAAPNYPGGAPPNEPGAVTAMVLGILGIAVCGVIAPFAWSMGKKSLANVRASHGQWSGEGMAQAGYIMGIIGTILLIFIAIIVVMMFVLSATLSAGPGHF